MLAGFAKDSDRSAHDAAFQALPLSCGNGGPELAALAAWLQSDATASTNLSSPSVRPKLHYEIRPLRN